jgi:hypothetical protein
MDAGRDDDRVCPSARCEEGAILLGIVGRDGVVGYVQPQIVVGQDFVDAATRGRTPEKRFRFAGPCVEAECAHWTGARCGVIDRVMQLRDQKALTPSPDLPRCTIRPLCRWFAQRGPEACQVCPLVVTDLTPVGRQPSDPLSQVATP